MSTNPLDVAIEDLRMKVESNITVGGGAIVFIQSVPGLIQTAVDEAIAAGATPEQLQAITDLGTKMTEETAAFEAALNTNVTPQARRP